MTTFASQPPSTPETRAAALGPPRDPGSSANRLAAVPAELPLEVVAQREDTGTVILQATGSVDGTSTGAFKRAVLSEIHASRGVVVVDLSGLAFLSVSGVQALATLRQVADLHGRSIKWVTGGNPSVRRALRAARIAATETIAGYLAPTTQNVPNIPQQQGVHRAP